MTNLILVFFCLLPFSPFFFKNVDIWHGTGQYVQVGMLILFCYSFFEKPKSTQILNKSLGSFICWAGLVTSCNWIIGFAITKHYPIKIFFPFFNLLCVVWLYKLIVEYLDSNDIEKILKWIRYSILLVLFYCVLQVLCLDQFFKDLDLSGVDKLVGTIGNQSHLSAFFAVVQPLFFNKKRENILALILLWLIIILAGSISGIVCGTVVVLFWLFFKNKKLAIVSSALSIIIFVFMFLTHYFYFTSGGRFEIWVQIFDIFKKKPITGLGLGSFGALGINNLGHWQHLHNEYYQVAFELGIIGLTLIFWCIWDYFKLFKTIKSDLSIRLASMFVGFCLLGLFTFNAHLWQIAIFGIFSYSSIFAIKNSSGTQCLGV